MFLRHRFAFATGLFVLIPATPVLAQTAAAGADAPASRLEEIVVTARKREESLQDVPVSVGTVTSESLEDYRLRDMSDLTNKVPNLIMPTLGFNSLQDITVRGVNVAVRNAGFTPSVSFYVDGVYLGRPSNFNQMLVDVERVEVLFGPQGTLFGNNTIGGAVNIVTPRPTSEREGFVRTGVGNYNLREVAFLGNTPLTDSLATRVAITGQWRDGYKENLFTGQDHGNLDRWAGRMKLLWTGERTSVLLTGSYQTGDERPASQEYVEQGASVFPADPPFDSGYTSAPEPFAFLQDPSRSEFERAAASVHVDHEINDHWDLVSITALQRSTADDLVDNDWAAEQRLRAEIRNGEEQRLISQEFRLASDPAERASVTLGLYYLKDRVKLDKDFDYLPPFEIIGPLGANGLAIESFSVLETESAAIFGNVDYDILPNFELSAGIRYSAEDMETRWDQQELFRVLGLPTNEALPLGPMGGLLIANAPRYTDERSDDLWSGTVTLSYFFPEARMIYARYARGTKSGGFDLEPLPNPLPPTRSFGKESMDNYEVGFKTQWMDDRLRFNVTGFYQEYHDLQRADLIPLDLVEGAFTRTIRNAAEVEVKGAEVFLELEPLEGLNLSAAYGRASAKFVEYRVNSGADLTGLPLSGVPKWNGTLNASYSRTLGNEARVDVGVAAEFRGDRLLGPSDVQSVNVDGYHVVNAHVAFTSASDRWGLNLWANNLTDELYVTQRGGGSDFYSAEVVAFGMPRTYGANLTVRFGGL